ncbi:Serine/threonine-protein kinase Nek8 [Myotis davidii]|uniref:non-specific serine/threonine protein kinase n=1 Tax=Myotis davidii TaxID=225400 RepID=L5LKK7_MYODS|nr:Serine/threonine-protein kinase Nek8 [Myotis davidii]
MEKYERIRVVGRGAFGIVHLCLRKADQKLVIIKQIPVEQMTKEERQAAQNECQVLKLLNHPNVIEYYENFLEDKALMIAMEYAPGGTLAEFIQKRCNSLLEEETILHFFVQILLALHHVHTHLILHRDLKTQNILLDKHRMVVKIGDFGISKILSSKSKAYTVVGTPCYISPELCEGKPYNQKSDIWALGCVLYELASLKRAFEAANLPALVLKIMSGTFAPISDRYSPELRQLVLSLLSLEPAQRPPLSHIMAQPLCMRALLNLHTDLGSVRMRRPVRGAGEEKSLATGPPIAPGNTGSRITSARCRGVPRGPARPAIPPPLSSVYTWGGGLSAPLRLPMLNTEVVQVATGRTQKAGVTRSGRLILWEAPPLGGGGGALLPGAVEQQQPQFVSRFLEGQSGVTIKHVACGDLFTACLTDRGIIMTFGSGSNGCLGHGSLNDISQPTIVEALLGYEMVQVACGASHVLALSTERELFAWGRGDGGRLGLGTRESYNCPQQVPMPPGQEAQRVVCGIDSSMILTVPGRVLACGSNRFNKLGLDHLSLGEEPAPHQQVEEVLSFTALCSAPLDQETLLSVDLGTAHSAAVTASGDCYTFGSNQHGQLGTNARRVSRAPCQVQGLQGIKIAMVACGDAFTVAIGAGQGRNVGAAEDRAEFPLAQRQPCLPSQPGSQEPVARLRLPGTWRLQSRAPGRHVAPGTELYPRQKQTFVARPGPYPGEGVFKCPEDQLPLDYAKIYPDPELEVQVLGLPIRCIHSEEGCRWSGPLRHLQGHLNTCSFNVVPCPNRCPTKLSRRDLPAHLQHDCPKRRLKCEFCGCDFSGEAFESHEGVCPQESVYCENKCGARMMRRLLAQHATSECPKRTQPCTYCTKEFVFDTIQSHQYQCPRLPVPCPNQCGVGTVAREDLPGHLKDSCSTALVLCPFKDSGCKHRCPKLAMARHVEESVKPHLAMMCALVSRQRQELQELRRELEELSVGSDGVLIWKIGSYGRRLQEAKAKPNLECFSPAFYTHKYGYKLQVSAFLNGNGSGEGTHLSLYIRVLPGAFDNLLEWPFARRVTFSLLDQSDPGLAKPQHVTETFHPDPNWKNFQKPGTWRGSLDESSLGFGYPKFISHQDIRKRNYVRDDAVFIRASVELPRKILS